MADRDRLIQSLTALIQAYDRVIEVLDQKIEAVVKNDLDRITSLAEEQIANNNALETLELQFKTCLKSFAGDKTYPEGAPKLSDLLSSQFHKDKTIKELRTRLLSRVADSQRLQYQLNSLLSFAREHIEQTLQNIYAINKKPSVRYDQKGRKNTEEHSIFSRYA